MNRKRTVQRSRGMTTALVFSALFAVMSVISWAYSFFTYLGSEDSETNPYADQATQLAAQGSYWAITATGAALISLGLFLIVFLADTADRFDPED